MKTASLLRKSYLSLVMAITGQANPVSQPPKHVCGVRKAGDLHRDVYKRGDAAQKACMALVIGADISNG